MLSSTSSLQAMQRKVKWDLQAICKTLPFLHLHFLPLLPVGVPPMECCPSWTDPKWASHSLYHIILLPHNSSATGYGAAGVWHWFWKLFTPEHQSVGQYEHYHCVQDYKMNKDLDFVISNVSQNLNVSKCTNYKLSISRNRRLISFRPNKVNSVKSLKSTANIYMIRKG